MPTNPDGSLRQYNASEVAAFKLKTRGVRADHEHWQEETSQYGAILHRWFSCAWDKRYDVVNYIVGQVPITYSDSGTIKISRIPPQKHPDPLRAASNWVATGITEIRGYKFTGDMDASGVPIFERAEIRVQYEPVPYMVLADDQISLESDRYLSFEGSPGDPVSNTSNYTTLTGNMLEYKRNPATGTGPPHGKPVPFSVGFVENDEHWSLTWNRLPQEIWQTGSAIKERVEGDPSANPITLPYIGAINKFTDPIKRKPGTTMLKGVTPKFVLDPTGLGYVWNLKMDFLTRKKGFLNLYNFETGASGGANNGYFYVANPAAPWREPEDVLDGETLHWVRDFAKLFDPN